MTKRPWHTTKVVDAALSAHRRDHRPALDHELDGIELSSVTSSSDEFTTTTRDRDLTILSRSSAETARMADPYRLAVSDLRDKLETYQHLLANNRRKAEELVAEAEGLEDACRPLEEHIDSLQALIRLAGGAA